MQSWEAFRSKFGNYLKERPFYWPWAVKGYFENGGRNIYIIEIPFPGDRNQHW